MQQLYLDCLTVKVFWYSKLVQKHLKELVSGWESYTQPWFSYVAHKLSKFLRMNQKWVWLQMLLISIEDLEIRRKAPHLKTPGFCSTHFVVRKVSWQESICSRTHPSGSPSIAEEGERAPPHTQTQIVSTWLLETKPLHSPKDSWWKCIWNSGVSSLGVWVPHVMTEKHIPSWEDTSQTSIFKVTEHW